MTRTTLLGRLLLPPSPEAQSAERFRQLHLVRAVIMTGAVAFDIFLYVLLRDAQGVRPEAVQFFAVINISFLSTSALLTVAFIRRPGKLATTLQALCMLLESAATMIWIQMTGTVTSYFLLAPILLVLLYRIAYGYWFGLAATTTMLVLQASAFGLEQTGVLSVASLFTAQPGGIYANPLYRWAAFSSIECFYPGTFISANFLAGFLRAKDRELWNLRRDLDRAVTEAQAGRLSGITLAGKYELADVLGRGSVGEVYQARRLPDGREVAVKVLLSDASDHPTARERFHREAEVIARLPRTCVAEFLEMGQHDGNDYIVMELLHGEDLGAFLRRRGQLPIDELVRIVQRIAAALDAAHALGIVHRDLKPSNIFVSDDTVRLLDFGIARLLEADSRTLTMAQVVLGSPGYLAPEQARSQASEIGPHTDVFALGAILYRALTGRNAFPSRNPVAAAYEALCHHPPRPSSIRDDLPADVDCVVVLALAKKIEDRYARASALARDLERAVQGTLEEATRVRGRTLVDTTPNVEATLTGTTVGG